MTPRSKKYFAMKKTIKHIAYAFGLADVMIKIMKPIPRYPEGVAPSPAIVGEAGPELLMRPDGSIFTSHSRLIALEEPIRSMLLADEYIEKLRAAHSRRPINNPQSP